MSEMDYVQIISTVGFPIAAYLLIYLDLRKVLEKNTQAIEKLYELINARFK